MPPASNDYQPHLFYPELKKEISLAKTRSRLDWLDDYYWNKCRPHYLDWQKNDIERFLYEKGKKVKEHIYD